MFFPMYFHNKGYIGDIWQNAKYRYVFINERNTGFVKTRKLAFTQCFVFLYKVTHKKMQSPQIQRIWGLDLAELFHTNTVRLDIPNRFVSFIHKLFAQSLEGVKFTA